MTLEAFLVGESKNARRLGGLSRLIPVLLSQQKSRRYGGVGTAYHLRRNRGEADEIYQTPASTNVTVRVTSVLLLKQLIAGWMSAESRLCQLSYLAALR
jgi:hypothetical protein